MIDRIGETTSNDVDKLNVSFERSEQFSQQVGNEAHASKRNSHKEIEFTERDVEICIGFTEAAVLDAMAYISPDGFDDDDDEVDLVELAGVVRDYMIEMISPKESDEIRLIETERHSAIELTEQDKEMCAVYVVYPWRDGVKYICQDKPAVDPAQVTAAVRNRTVQILQRLDCRDLVERSYSEDFILDRKSLLSVNLRD